LEYATITANVQHFFTNIFIFVTIFHYFFNIIRYTWPAYRHFAVMLQAKLTFYACSLGLD
jgi:hypothetical protein